MSVVVPCLIDLARHLKAVRMQHLLDCRKSEQAMLTMALNDVGKFCTSNERLADPGNLLQARRGSFNKMVRPRKHVLQKAKERYAAAAKGQAERLVSGSDDNTLYMWQPSSSKKSLARMTGHMQLVNQVCRSCPTLITHTWKVRCMPVLPGLTESVVSRSGREQINFHRMHLIVSLSSLA